MNLSDIKPVQQIASCDGANLNNEVVLSDEPLLLKGFASDWPAVRACGSLDDTAGYLSGFWSERPVTAYVGDGDMDGRFFYNEDFSGFNFRSGTASLPQVFQRLADTDRPVDQSSIYVGSTPVDQFLPGFRGDNDLPIDADDVLVSFWLGTATRISAHYDFPDNLACVVSGHRRFILFPPDQVSNLYVGPLDRNPSGQAISMVDFSAPDFERFPRSKTALENALVAELEPGDVLFVPSLWWHQVEALDDFNLLINYWWCKSPMYLGSPTGALLHAMLTLRELPEMQKERWKKLFEHYVFDGGEEVYNHIPEAARSYLAPLSETDAKRLRAELLNRLNR